MPNKLHTGSEDFSPEFVAGILQHALGTTGNPGVYGIVGLQGSGKSTLAAQLVKAGKARGLTLVALSIDDFYLGKRERNQLARNVHPLLAMRGPPGTHDVPLACRVLDRLKRGKPACVPRFDKSRDTRVSPSRSKTIESRVDLVILEGWCLFATPENDAALQMPLNRLEHERDKDGIWRRYCNEALREYRDIWRLIDRSLFLQGPGFDQVAEWRWQQEERLQRTKPHRKTMTKKQVEEFVLLFERTSHHAFRQLPARADLVVRLDRHRRPW